MTAQLTPPNLIDRDGDEWAYIGSGYHALNTPTSRDDVEQIWGPVTEKLAPPEPDGPSDYGSARAQLTLLLLGAIEHAGIRPTPPQLAELERFVVDGACGQPQMLRGLLSEHSP